jgi:hypothetical protein
MPTSLNPPSAPTLVRLSADAMQLDWDSAGNATSFDVYRTNTDPYLPSTTFTKVGNVPISGGGPDSQGTHYQIQDTGLVDKTQYWYKLVAVNSTGNSGPSPISTVPPLGTPSGLQATHSGTTEIDVTWNPNLDAEGAEVYRSTDRMQYTLVATINEAAPFNYQDKNITSGVQYWYKVRVWSFNGYSPLSTSVTP